MTDIRNSRCVPQSRLYTTWCAFASLLLLMGTGIVQAQTIIRASHQWPGGIGDVRDEMIQIIARAVNAADVGLTVRVYPGQSLLKASDQWSAVVAGHLDLTALPLDYASGRHPEFNATLMPGLVKNHDHARRLSKSPFMASIKQIIDEAGALVLADAWLAGGFASAERCILWPKDIEGQVIRAAGPAFERMLVGAGASIASMPSSEIYTAMQTGVLDAANTSSGSFVSYRIYEQASCMTAPGDNALWFMYEPVLMSKRRWNRLDETQRDAFRAAAAIAEEYFFEQAKLLDIEMENRFRDAGVEVVHMNAEQVQAWREIATRTSYATFAREVDGGAELIEQALAVE